MTDWLALAERAGFSKGVQPENFLIFTLKPVFDPAWLGNMVALYSTDLDALPEEQKIAFLKVLAEAARKNQDFTQPPYIGKLDAIMGAVADTGLGAATYNQTRGPEELEACERVARLDTKEIKLPPTNKGGRGR